MSEAEKIYRAIFKRNIPLSLEEKFSHISPSLSAQFSSAQQEQYSQALAHVADLEALELAGRMRRRLPLLVHSFQIMVHLAETLPENQDIFVRRKANRISAFLAICRGAFRTLFKLIKGLVLLRKMDHV